MFLTLNRQGFLQIDMAGGWQILPLPPPSVISVAEMNDVDDETDKIHSCYAAAGKNISDIFLGVKSTF